jgi:gliding motility-associated-like protein
VYVGGVTTLSVTPGQGYLYQWEPKEFVSNPNESTTAAAPTTTTNFVVFVTDPNNPNCSYQDNVEVQVYEINCGEPNIVIPNAFSPNNDGANDGYRVTGQVLETINLQIFNRWGELVFETTELEHSWDGTFKGKPLDAAVFVYQLEATCVDGQEFTQKGNISLVK